MSIWTPLPLEAVQWTKQKSNHRKVVYAVAGFLFFCSRVVFPALKNQ
jgi:hypothetical protein